jgi:hypothetical protein
MDLIGDVVFDFLVGKHAVIVSSILGLVGAAALAVPPIESLSMREVMLKWFRIGDDVEARAAKSTKEALIAEARHLLQRERVFNILGAGFLFLSFAVLLANRVYCAIGPIGVCHD